MHQHPLENNDEARAYFDRINKPSTGLGSGAYRKAVIHCTGHLPAWAVPRKGGRKSVKAHTDIIEQDGSSSERIRSHDPIRTASLDYQMGVMIRNTCLDWNSYTLQQRRDYVSHFLALRNEFRIARGPSASITSPWTLDEVDVVSGGFHTCEHGLSPLENAVRVTERSMNKYGKLPRTLDSRVYVRGPLDNVPHAKTLEDLQMYYAAPIRGEFPTKPLVSTSSQERKWISIAERGLNPA